MLKQTWKSYVASAALAAMAFSAGCDAGSDAPPDEVGTTGLKLAMDIVGNTDVAGMQFELQPVSCLDGTPIPGAAPIVIQKDLEDILLPGGIPEFGNAPFDPDSQHVFADAFLVVDAGCYDITTTPIDAEGAPSEDCRPASARRVEVVESMTTEVFLINQCDARDPGAIDIGTGLNHAPELISLEFTESKFGLRCDEQTICATVLDVDGDPLEFAWNMLVDLPFEGPSVVSEIENQDGSVTQCVEITPLEAGRYEVLLQVYDLITVEGALVRVEDYLAATGNPAESHAELTFPFYAADQGPDLCRGVNVGYYDMFSFQGNPNQVTPIMTAGGVPVDVLSLSAEELAGLDVLFVQNPSNGDFGSEYLSQLGAIEEAVANGLVLIIHDRFVEDAESILPGGSGFEIIREPFGDGANIDIVDNTTLVTNGPGGVLDNGSLDGGFFSNHGFAVAGSLPGDSVQILSRTNPSELVTMCYGFGAGAVVYSTIPLDHYLDNLGPNPANDNLRLIYAPNVVAYGLAGACAN
jgi:hypothetical protein